MGIPIIFSQLLAALALQPRACLVVIEAFGGISTVTEAILREGLPLVAFLCFEVDESPILVSQAVHDIEFAGDITCVPPSFVDDVVLRFPHAFVVITRAPPCTNVSRISRARDGAWGAASSLREFFGGLAQNILQRASERCVALMERTAMAPVDRAVYDDVFHTIPFELCSRWSAPLRRRRRWWPSEAHRCPAGTCFESSRAASDVRTVVPRAERLRLRHVIF